MLMPGCQLLHSPNARGRISSVRKDDNLHILCVFSVFFNGNIGMVGCASIQWSDTNLDETKCKCLKMYYSV